MDAQRERLAAYATAHGVKLMAIESDEALSGKLGPERRPGLTRALRAVRTGEASGILVLKLDRLSRSTRDVLDLVDESGRGGWRLVSVSEHLDTGTAAGRLVVTVLAALAQMEREQVGERTQFALDAIAREGRARSRFIPFGWRNADGETTQRKGDRRAIVENAIEQTQLTAMLALRGSGLGARRIARQLNQQFPASPRTGREWTAQNVAVILRSHERRRAALATV